MSSTAIGIFLKKLKKIRESNLIGFAGDIERHGRGNAHGRRGMRAPLFSTRIIHPRGRQGRDGRGRGGGARPHTRLRARRREHRVQALGEAPPRTWT